MVLNGDINVGNVVKNVSSVVYRLLQIFVTIYCLYIPINSYSTPFSWHVIISALSLIPIGAEALMLFASDNAWSLGLEKQTKKKMHGINMGLSLFLMILGVSLEIDRGTRVPNYSHFTSAHAITGLIAMILMIVASFCGLAAYFAQGLKGYLKPVITKFVHNILGHLAFIFGIVSLCLGYYTDWFSYYTSDSARTSIAVVTVIVGVWSLIHPFVSGVKQVQAIMNLPVYRGVPIEVQGVNRPLSIIRLNQDVINES